MNPGDVQSIDSNNIGGIRIATQIWSGIHVHDVHINALPGRSWHPLSCDQPVLSVVINELHGQCEARLSLNDRKISRRAGRQRPNGHVSLIPANVSAWGYSEGIDQVDEVRLVMAIDRVKEVMGEEFTSAPFQEPRLVFNDESLQSLGRLLTDGWDKAEWSPLFGDGLVAAMIARLSNLARTPARDQRHFGLSPRQLSAVTEFIRDNLAATIRLSELSSLVGLSPSQFGRTFKVSTGTSPHLWHLAARIERAKQLLPHRSKSLVEIALDVGFSEQSHFNRAFRAATGMSPGAWRRNPPH